ncbi:MAG: hypothetical protein KAK00_10720 [Nanoarchaeota archaeon]|nr:hypothetical protein [Nanoarchaeota archaeon]
MRLLVTIKYDIKGIKKIRFGRAKKKDPIMFIKDHKKRIIKRLIIPPLNQ